MRQQEATEVTQLTRQALALASSVANSSDIWVASRDFSGLQEIVLGLVGYPDLRHAMVLDSRGQVLAHSDPSRRGKYLTDLPAPIEPRILSQDQQQIDVVTPIMLAGRHVGWARIGLGRAILNAQFAKTRRDAVLYSLLTISLGALFAALAVRYLTRRLRAVQQVADAVHAGQLDRQTFSQGFVTNYPLAIQHVSGKVTEVIYNASVYHGEDGSILGIFAAARDITDLKKMEEEIRQLAFFDPLTQLPNRRMFTDRLSQAMVASQRNGSFGALIYLDLDNFKPVNDHFGHAAGDLLLIEVATRLTSCVRAVDTVGRTGGDEFVVILGDLNADPAQAVAEASQIAGGILMALSHPYHLALPQQGRETMHVQHRCTASMGVSLFLGQQASQQDIMKWGDAAMYQAKQAGGNRVQFHQPVAAQPAPEIFSTHHGS
ncbi:MAG: diguanylate cyclase domain-containing protein [Rhodoferax sp.]